jgi:hypothetical protein
LEKYCEKRGEQNNGDRGKISNKGKLFRISELRNDEEECFLSGPESGASFVRGPESGGQTLDSKDGRYKLCKHLGHYIVILYLFSLICLNKKVSYVGLTFS